MLCPGDFFPGKSTEASCCFLLQGIFQNPVIKSTSPAWQTHSIPLSYQGSPKQVVGNLQIILISLWTMLLGTERKKVKLLSRVQLFETPWTVACQTALSMEFFRQGYWSGLPFPSPGDLPYPGFESGFPALQADSLPSEPICLNLTDLGACFLKLFTHSTQ